MENRAEDQVALSAELLKEGNREEALQAALEAQEEGDTPVIPEEIYALNSALYSYHHEGNVEGFGRTDRWNWKIIQRISVKAVRMERCFSVWMNRESHIFTIWKTGL